MTRKLKLNGSNEIGRSVERSLDEYFKRLDGETPTGVYDMVIGHVERALLVSIMDRANGNQTQAADMLGMNRNTLRVQAHPLQDHLMAAKVAQALLSVSDKTGLVDFARGLVRARRQAALHRRHRQGAGRRRAGRHGCRQLHGLSGDARRARQDAASQGARRHPGAPRPPRARRRARRARHSDHRPGRRQSLSVPRRPSPSRAARSTTPIENIDIGGPSMVRAAAKNWPHVGIVVDPADYARRAGRTARRTAARSTDATRFRLMRKAFAHTASYDGAIANWLTARGPDGAVAGFPRLVPLRRRQGAGDALRRESAPDRRVLSRRDARAPARSPRTGNCRARNCRTTTSRTATPRGSASRRSRNRPASSSSTPIRAAWPSRRRRSRPTKAHSPPIRRPPSAASSRSTDPSTPPRSTRSPRSSSRW